MSVTTQKFYDLHIHSCLSPCADKEMTPNNIINMSLLKGLDVIALTDHCTCKNCGAASKIAEKNGLGFISGMELTTSEEIHVICLFENLGYAMEFDSYVYDRLPNIKNKVHIFGEQNICDENDEVVGQVEKLLINAASIGIGEVQRLMVKFHGIAFPAHIEKSSNSILSILGLIPDEYEFSVVEVKDKNKLLNYIGGEKILDKRLVLKNSDAHYLGDISERENSLNIADPYFSNLKEKFT